MILHGLKEQAIKLRISGLPINQIKDKLGVSKSTVSLWCRDISLTKEQYRKIKKEHILKTQKGRLLGAQINKNKKIESISEADRFGKAKIKSIDKKELLFIATALYWAEGSKSEKSTGFQFINSDPEMIILIKKFLIECMGVKENELMCSIQINESHKYRISEVLSFWINLIQLHQDQFRKPYFIKTKAIKVYKNNDTYYGICRLIVRRSTKLKYKMLALIKAMKENIMPA